MQITGLHACTTVPTEGGMAVASPALTGEILGHPLTGAFVHREFLRQLMSGRNGHVVQTLSRTVGTASSTPQTTATLLLSKPVCMFLGLDACAPAL